MRNPPLPPLSRPFLGRSADCRRILGALSRSRLVTVRGPGGIGKTSAALAVARWLLRRGRPRDGVAMVSLRGARSAEAVRFALGQRTAGAGVSGGELLARLRGRQMLLVLDHAEDSLATEPDELRALLARLLRRASGLRILLASRVALGAGGRGPHEVVVDSGRTVGRRLGTAAGTSLLWGRHAVSGRADAGGAAAGASAGPAPGGALSFHAAAFRTGPTHPGDRSRSRSAGRVRGFPGRAPGGAGRDDCDRQTAGLGLGSRARASCCSSWAGFRRAGWRKTWTP